MELVCDLVLELLHDADFLDELYLFLLLRLRETAGKLSLKLLSMNLEFFLVIDSGIAPLHKFLHLLLYEGAHHQRLQHVVVFELLVPLVRLEFHFLYELLLLFLRAGHCLGPADGWSELEHEAVEVRDADIAAGEGVVDGPDVADTLVGLQVERVLVLADCFIETLYYNGHKEVDKHHGYHHSERGEEENGDGAITTTDRN